MYCQSAGPRAAGLPGMEGAASLAGEGYSVMIAMRCRENRNCDRPERTNGTWEHDHRAALVEDRYQHPQYPRLSEPRSAPPARDQGTGGLLQRRSPGPAAAHQWDADARFFAGRHQRVVHRLGERARSAGVDWL